MTNHPKNPFQSKRASRRVSDSIIGSHIPRHTPSSSRASSSRQISHSTVKRNARAKKGIVETVIPDTASGESPTEHARRVRKEHFALAMQRRVRIKRMAIGLIVALFIFSIAVAVGIFVYTNSVSSKLSLSDTSTRAALSAAEEGKPSYALLVGEFYEPGKDYPGPEMLMLARLDPESLQVTLTSIPVDTQVHLSNGEYGKIAWAQLLGGDTALIQEVSDLAEVPISHIVKTDEEGLVALVDAYGGISVDVSEEVDDPIAGSIYLEAGHQVLSGEAALTYCRATNFSTGRQMQATNQSNVITALAKKMLEQGSFTTFFSIDTLADTIETDLDFFSVSSMIKTYKGISDENIYSTQIPGYSSTNAETNIEYFIVDDAKWQDIRKAIKEGQSPDAVIPEPVPVDPASFTITVRNGSGVTGSAQQVADTLSAAGYKVTETGNTDQFVYDETLVIYAASEMQGAAKAAANELQIGKVISSNGFYSFETGILIVVGKDWKPLH